MAISTQSVFEVRTTGTDTNGGGFVAGAAGSDYSQQAAKNTVGNDISTTDGVGNGSTTFTSATANFQTTIVGNIIYLQGGTGGLAAGWYQVTARASTTSITLDRAVAAGTGITMNIGGCLASIGAAGAAINVTTGPQVWVQAGAYNISVTTNNLSNGTFKAFPSKIIGYQTTRGDYGTKPVLTFTVSGVLALDSFAASGAFLGNIVLDGNSQLTSRGINIGGGTDTVLFRVECRNMVGIAYNVASSTQLVECSAIGCSVAPFAGGGQFIDCIARGNTGVGFNISGNQSTLVRCISAGNTGATTDGFVIARDTVVLNCIAYANGRHGFSFPVQTVLMQNNIAESNVGTGFISTFTTFPFPTSVLLNNAAFGNGTNFNVNANNYSIIGSIIGVSSFFTSPATGDFSLNNTAGAGAACRAAGYPGVFPLGLTTGFLDIGAAQHSGGGGSSPVPFATVAFN